MKIIDWCFIVSDPCISNPCNNGGSCTSNGDNTYTCGCLDMYYGENCEKSK